MQLHLLSEDSLAIPALPQKTGIVRLGWSVRLPRGILIEFCEPWSESVAAIAWEGRSYFIPGLRTPNRSHSELVRHV
jgi:hypothetical protein